MLDAFRKKSWKTFALLWRIGAASVLHAVKEVTGGFLPQNKADGIDNTSDNLNPSFCHGGFQR